jgi:hypothetical protein
VRCLKDNDNKNKNKKHRGRERGGVLSQRANTLFPLGVMPLSAISADNNCLLDDTLRVAATALWDDVGFWPPTGNWIASNLRSLERGAQYVYHEAAVSPRLLLGLEEEEWNYCRDIREWGTKKKAVINVNNTSFLQKLLNKPPNLQNSSLIVWASQKVKADKTTEGKTRLPQSNFYALDIRNNPKQHTNNTQRTTTQEGYPW